MERSEDARRRGLPAGRFARRRRTLPGRARAAVRAAVQAVGEQAAEFGAHSLRIGAATDMRDLLGVEAGRAVIKGRGRWRSDVYEIYTRADMGASLEASARMAHVDAVEVEAVFGGWADPA